MNEDRKILSEREIDEIRKERYGHYYDSTKTVSSINRELSMVGVALVWMFRTSPELSDKNKSALLFALLLFISAIVLDLVFYMIRQRIYFVYGGTKATILKKNEETEKEEKHINPIPLKTQNRMDYLWWFRITLVIIGYVVVLFNIIKIVLIVCV